MLNRINDLSTNVYNKQTFRDKIHILKYPPYGELVDATDKFARDIANINPPLAEKKEEALKRSSSNILELLQGLLKKRIN